MDGTRTKENNGIIPDNVGLSGKIGEYRSGQWWGGFFGWTGRYSVWMIFHALITSSECAYLMSGDPKYLGFLRSQVDMLLDRAIIRDGNLLVPYKVGPGGWYDYRPMEPFILSHLWHASMDPQDWERIERIRKGCKAGPHAYAYSESPDPPAPDAEMWRPDGTPFDWNAVHNDLSRNKHVLYYNEPPHLRFLAGDNTDWSEKILQAEYEQVCRAVHRFRSGNYEHPWPSQTILHQNPIFTHGLAQMTMGAPITCFNGGILCARVRYFDLDRARPGLPEDIAALIEKLKADRTILQLVNTNAMKTRKLIVQGGAFGEHEFTEVKFYERSKDLKGKAVFSEKTIPVHKKYFAVELPPAASIRLKIGTRCYVNQPTYDFPWNGAQAQR